MKKFHFRHQKIIHHYIVYGYFKREVRDTFNRYLWHGYSKIPQEKRIDDIQYNVLDSAFYFIFDVGNPSHLAIKVPRKSLENDELPNTKKNIFNGLIKTIYGCIDCLITHSILSLILVILC